MITSHRIPHYFVHLLSWNIWKGELNVESTVSKMETVYLYDPVFIFHKYLKNPHFSMYRTFSPYKIQGEYFPSWASSRAKISTSHLSLLRDITYFVSKNIDCYHNLKTNSFTVFQPEGRCFCHHEGCVLEQNHTEFPACARACSYAQGRKNRMVGRRPQPSWVVFLLFFSSSLNK